MNCLPNTSNPVQEWHVGPKTLRTQKLSPDTSHLGCEVSSTEIIMIIWLLRLLLFSWMVMKMWSCPILCHIFCGLWWHLADALQSSRKTWLYSRTVNAVLGTAVSKLCERVISDNGCYVLCSMILTVAIISQCHCTAWSINDMQSV